MLSNKVLFIIIFIFFALILKSKYIELFKNDNIIFEDPPFPIDVVYTWAGEKLTNNQRSSNNNELKYSLRSIIKFAPWVNKIYILMNPPKKIPSWFNENYHSKVIILDHFDTFKNYKYLPNTNSNAIETTLSEIPGLSDNYIYFNDDVFLGNPTQWYDFFKSKNEVFIPNTCTKGIPLSKEGNYLNVLPEYPFENFSKKNWIHIPIARLKSQQKDFEMKYDYYIKWVRSVKTRKSRGCDICKINNLNCPCQQQHHLLSLFMYNNNVGIPKNYYSNNLLKYFNSSMIYNDRMILNNFKKKPSKFFCINDTSNSKKVRIIFRQEINRFFEEMYPEKAFFEK